MHPMLDVPALVGRRITELRRSAGLSLSELARRSELGKGTLSELEAGRRNPTLETLYALTVPLGIGLADLIDLGVMTEGARGAVSGDGVIAVLLDVIVDPVTAFTTEVYRLVIHEGGFRLSPAHGEGVREQLTLVSGAAEVGRLDAQQRIGVGDTARWVSDGEHSFQAFGDVAAVGVLLIAHPAHQGGRSTRRAARR